MAIITLLLTIKFSKVKETKISSSKLRNLLYSLLDSQKSHSLKNSVYLFYRLEYEDPGLFSGLPIKTNPVRFLIGCTPVVN